MQPQLTSGTDAPEDDDTPQNTTPGPARWWTRLASGDLWLAAATVTVALVIAAGALFLLWLILAALFHLLVALCSGLAHGGSWLATGPVAQIVTGPVHGYLQAHDAGLPATTDQLWCAWLVSTAVLFAAAVFGHSRGARIGWTLLGAASTAMVWAGAAPHSRWLAAGIAVAAWSLLSIPAFTPTVHPDRTIVLGERAADPTQSGIAPVPQVTWVSAMITATPGARLQWGVLITTPSAASICTAARNQAQAATEARAANKARPGSARLIYREVTTTPWREDATGEEFGIRHQWPDGHTEDQETSDRHEADYLIRCQRGTGITACVISRDAVYGPWLTADAAAVGAS